MTPRNAVIALHTPAEGSVLQALLEPLGVHAICAFDGARTLDLATRRTPDLIVADLHLPVIGGIELCQILRGKPAADSMIIVLVASNSNASEELSAFDAGADEFLSRPLNGPIFVARMKALFRRKQVVVNGGQLAAGDMLLMRDELIVKQGHRAIRLTAREFALLYYLASRSGKVVRRESLLDAIWNDDDVYDRTVDVYIKRLREKISGDYIETVRGIGYRFIENAKRQPDAVPLKSTRINPVHVA